MEDQYKTIEKDQMSNIVDFHLEEFYYLGYTIIENVLADNEIIILREEVQRVYKKQEESFTKEKLKIINEEYLSRALLCESEAYLKLAKNELILNYVKRILGEYFILHLQNGIINMPKEEHHQSKWHRDLPYQNWVCSEPLACNAFYCLDIFNSETGATYLLPFSHKIHQIPSTGFLEKHAIQINAQPGAVILFDSMIFHRAGYNNSHLIRRGINHIYTKAIIRQQIDFPLLLSGKYSDDPLLNMLLGYDAQTVKNVDDFRNRRISKIQS